MLVLKIDHPIIGPNCSSNEGHTAHTFFGNTSLTAEITGTKVEGVDRKLFHSSRVEPSRVVCQWIENNWYYTPVTADKIILVHGAAVIQNRICQKKHRRPGLNTVQLISKYISKCRLSKVRAKSLYGTCAIDSGESRNYDRDT